MNNRHIIVISPVWLWPALLCLAFAGFTPSAVIAQDNRAADPTLRQRLNALAPDDAMAYFTLGEDLGYAPDATDEMRRLARELLLIAASIDRERASPTGLDRSAALALADLAGSESERRWLRATAEALAIERRSSEPAPSWPVDTAAIGSDDLNLRVAETLARARANDGIRVQRELSRSPVERTLLFAGIPGEEARGIMGELNIVAGTRYCPGCRNERTVRTRAGDGRMVLVRCPVCNGNPGAQLTETQYLNHVRAEALVLRVNASDWSTDLFLSDSRPLNDTGFEELLRRYQVNPDARLWQPASDDPAMGVPRGRWVAPARAEPEAPDESESSGVDAPPA